MAMDSGVGGVPAAYRWSFGKAEFDEGRWQLAVDGQAVELEHKPLEVLQYLLRHAGEAVTKEELLAAVWDGRVVVEAVLTNAVGKLRRALGDDTGAMIATLPKVGYRLEGRVNHQAVEYIPPGSRLSAGDAVPRRSNWRLEEALALAGCTLQDVAKVNVWLDDPRDFGSFNRVYMECFGEHRPARSTVESRLMIDAKVEIDVTAYKPL